MSVDTIVEPATEAVADQEPAPQISSNAKSPAAQIVEVLGSSIITAVVIALLMVLTYIGTVAQTRMALSAAQQLYFDSWICPLELGPLVIPFPGAYLLLVVLGVNLVIGGVLRMRRNRSTVGILIAHLGTLFLLLAGFVKFHYSVSGFMDLGRNEAKTYFESGSEWEIAIGQRLAEGKAREYLIPHEHFATDSVSSFHNPAIPFRRVVKEYFGNCVARMAGQAAAGLDNVVEGIYLRQTTVPKGQSPAAGVYVDIHVPDQPVQRAILWAHQLHPFTVRVGGEPWSIDLRRKIRDLPFGIRLEKFIKEEHAGTTMARRYASDVTMIEGDVEQAVHISMNEPLRHGGFVLYQSSFRPDRQRPGEFRSVFEVANNPSDMWPMIACVIMAIGLTMHFVRKLVIHIELANRGTVS